MTKKDKISDIPSYSKLQKDVDGFSMLGNFLRVFTIFSSKDSSFKEALSKLPELKKQTEHFLELPDKFNDYFSDKGWIAHESMNTPIMEQAIDLAEQGDFKKGEEILSNYFTSPDINWLLNRFRVLPEFSIRYNLIENAYQDTLERRYNSSIPIILMVIDGITNDVSKSKGFFNDQTDLSAWDSIAAHSTGLKSIRDIFNETRKKTNKDEIYLPYRNGILHGRDINYGNKYVVGKCWCTLFALNDWAQALLKQKKNPLIIEKPKTVKENLQEIGQVLRDYNEHQKWHKKITTDIENWKPREFETSSFDTLTFENFSPEKEVVNLLINWKAKNYGKIALQKHYFGSQEINIGKEAGKIRSDFKDKELKEFKILSIKDEAPAISEITAEINYLIQNKSFKKSIIFRMICKASDGRAGINGQPNVKWTFIDGFIYGLYI
jgi:hypothetical protein